MSRDAGPDQVKAEMNVQGDRDWRGMQEKIAILRMELADERSHAWSRAWALLIGILLGVCFSGFVMWAVTR